MEPEEVLSNLQITAPHTLSLISHYPSPVRSLISSLNPSLPMILNAIIVSLIVLILHAQSRSVSLVSYYPVTIWWAAQLV
jgi:hypothetical protein